MRIPIPTSTAAAPGRRCAALLALALGACGGGPAAAVWLAATPATTAATRPPAARGPGAGPPVTTRDSTRAAPAPPSLPLAGPHPTFGIGVTRHGPAPSTFYGLSVVRCGTGRTMWTMGTGGAPAPAPARVTYGEPARGYTSRAGPRPLTPGCYRVLVADATPMRFLVHPDGRVVEDTTRRR